MPYRFRSRNRTNTNRPRNPRLPNLNPRGPSVAPEVNREVRNQENRPTNQGSSSNVALNEYSGLPFPNSTVQGGPVPVHGGSQANTMAVTALGYNGQQDTQFPQYMTQYPRRTSFPVIEDQQQTLGTATTNAQALLRLLHGPRTSVDHQASVVQLPGDHPSNELITTEVAVTAQNPQAAEAFDVDQELRLMLERGEDMLRCLRDRQERK